MKRKHQESIEFYIKVFKLALPIALQSLITIGVNMLDTMMVGSLGDNPLSATSLANSLTLLSACFRFFAWDLEWEHRFSFQDTGASKKSPKTKKKQTMPQEH